MGIRQHSPAHCCCTCCLTDVNPVCLDTAGNLNQGSVLVKSKCSLMDHNDVNLYNDFPGLTDLPGFLFVKEGLLSQVFPWEIKDDNEEIFHTHSCDCCSKSVLYRGKEDPVGNCPDSRHLDSDLE